MTNKEIIATLKNAVFAPAGTIVYAYKTVIEEVLSRLDKYRWHDLRKDPADLPEVGAKVLYCFSIPFYKKGNLYNCDVYSPDVFKDSDSINYLGWNYLDEFEEDLT